MRLERVEYGAVEGLAGGEFRRLKQVVVLAGPNGAGKTRILRLVEGKARRAPDLRQQRTLLSKRIQSLSSSARTGAAEHRLMRDKAALASLETDGLVGERGRVFSITKALYSTRNFNNPSTAQRNVIRQADATLNKSGKFRNTVLLQIQRTQTRWYEATHQRFSGADAVRQEATEDYEGLKRMIGLLLGVSLDRSADGDATLFGVPLGQCPLSDGQQLLLCLAVALHREGATLGKDILFWDEPESHLHPAALTDVVKRLINATGDGQLWLATHSVQLLSIVPVDSIHFVKDGRVRWCGKQPEVVLKGLLGNDEQIARLSEFLGLPAQLAANGFASECLAPPDVVNTGADDPQTLQIAETLRGLRGEEPIRVLDFGAGKARLLANLADASERPVGEWLDYIAFDLEPDLACDGVVQDIYGSSDGRLFTKKADLRSLNDGSVDVLVLCNVLHEICPKDWPDIFGSEGVVRKLLGEDGHLLVVEDMVLPQGEQAHDYGFLILGAPELKLLFGAPEGSILSDSRREQRLQAHLLSAGQLSWVDQKRRSESLHALRERAKDELKRLRREPQSYKTGRLLGLWTQLFANCTLAIEEL